MAKPSKAALDAAAELFTAGLSAAVITKIGKEYAFGAELLGPSKDKAATYLAEHDEVATAIASRLKPEVSDGGVADSTELKSQVDQSEQGDRTVDLKPQGGAVSTPSKPPEPPAVADAVTAFLPLPAGVPAGALKDASVVVKAKAERGRWRAGRRFTREETLIPYAELNEAEIAALTGDPELIVGLRLIKPD